MRIPKSKTLYLLIAAAVAVIGGSADVAKAGYKSVTVTAHGQRRVVRGFTFGNIGSFLKENNIAFSKLDRVSPGLTVPVRDGMSVDIVAPKSITLVDGKEQTMMQTFAPTVADFLEQQGIQVGPKDRVDVPVESTLVDGETVQIQHQTKTTTTKTQTLQFQTIRRRTNALYAGQQRVLTHGVEGSEAIDTTAVYLDGKLVSKSVKHRIVKQPVNEVVEVGTAARPAPVQQSAHLTGRSSGSLVIEKTFTVVATAYVGGGRSTATGAYAGPGVIAVDPSVIPLGTKLYIPGVGVVRAEDTGGAIIGNRIDICMATTAQALAWGSRTITIYEVK